MPRARALPAVCVLAALQLLFHQVAAEEGVEVAWMPDRLCNDSPGDPKQNCARCNKFATVCELCMPGYSFDTKGQCAKCRDPLCQECDTSLSKCKKCKGVVDSDPFSSANPGYPVFMNAAGQCRQCTTQLSNVGCLKCDSTGSRCTLCNDGYYLKGGQCNKCKGGPNCQKCRSTDGVCTECKQTVKPPSFGLNAEKQCVRCADLRCTNCAANSKKCKSCVSGAPGTGQRGFGATAAGTCARCADALCAHCPTNKDKCWRCLSDDYSQVYPFMNPAGRCQLGRVRHCLFYRSDGTCRECKTGYLLERGKCAFLPTCEDPFCFDCRGDTSKCRKCKSGFFFNPRLGVCSQCVSGCAECTYESRFTCMKCKIGFGLTQWGRQCEKCAPQTSVPNGLPWCQTCNGNIHKCTLCFPPESYEPNSEGKCVPRR